jgi:hypothetical protein
MAGRRGQGITRRSTIELARQAGHHVDEGRLSAEPALRPPRTHRLGP